MRCFLMLTALVLGGAATAVEYEVDRDDALFCIVIKKAGIGAALAHNHLIPATDYEITFSYDPQNPSETEFVLALPAENLRADEAAMREKWSDTFVEVGMLDEPLGELDEDKRPEIRKSMLGEEQLDAAQHPEIKAELTALSPREGSENVYDATVALTAHGETVEEQVEVQIVEDGDKVAIEGVGSYRFTDFGIEPYSAFLGAVQNKDRFYLYAAFSAVPAGAGAE